VVRGTRRVSALVGTVASRFFLPST
jgi:hypothetical protein